MKAIVLFALLALPAPLFAQVSATPKRLVSQANYLNSAIGYQLHDSAHYSYSESRGSRYDPNYLHYTDLQHLGSLPDADLANQRIPAHNIDSAGLPSVSYDTAYFATGIGAAPPNSLISYEGHRYNSAGAVTQTYSSVFEPGNSNQQYGQRSIEIYTGGRLSRSYILGFSGVRYDTSFIRDYTYNINGQLVLDSLSYRLSAGNYLGYRKIVFAYGTAPGYISSTLFNFKASPSRLEASSKDSLSYYPDNRLRTRKSFLATGSGGFQAESLDSFGYSAGVEGFAYLREELLNASGAAEYTYYTVADHVNARGRKDSVTISGFRGAASLGNNRIAVVYDTAGDPLSRTDYFTSTGVAPYSIEYYRYEPIPVPAAGISNTASRLELTMFPNPTQGLIRYSLDRVAAGTSLRIEVVNLAGQLVYREQSTWSGTTQQLVLGPEAPAGQYILRIFAGPSGTGSSRQFTRL